MYDFQQRLPSISCCSAGFGRGPHCGWRRFRTRRLLPLPIFGSLPFLARHIMDDDSADIELLEQHLNRSRQLSTRVTSVLQKFDRRLQTLEQSILPLHKSTHSLTRLVDSQ